MMFYEHYRLYIYGLILFIFILFSAFFSGSETALTSCNKLRMRSRERTGDAVASRVMRLLDNYDETLSTILVGNNIVNLGSASLATVLFTELFGAAGVAYATLVMTIVVLIFGEILPKSFAKDYADSFSVTCSALMTLLMTILKPINYLLDKIRTFLTRRFAAPPTAFMTAGELTAIIDDATNKGSLSSDAGRLVKAAIKFCHTKASTILTPRVDVVAVDIAAPNSTILQAFTRHGFSRLPVYKGSIDHIIGLLYSKDFFQAYILNPTCQVEKIIRKATLAHESTQIDLLLTNMQKAKTELAIILDSYGGVKGIVSTEDIVEELVGEIYEQHDAVISSFHPLAEHKFLVTCHFASLNLTTSDLFRYLNLDMESYGVDYQSLSGWVMDTLSKIPSKGDSFTCRDLSITVNKTNMNRVTELLIAVKSKEVA